MYFFGQSTRIPRNWQFKTNEKFANFDMFSKFATLFLLYWLNLHFLCFFSAKKVTKNNEFYKKIESGEFFNFQNSRKKRKFSFKKGVVGKNK